MVTAKSGTAGSPPAVTPAKAFARPIVIAATSAALSVHLPACVFLAVIEVVSPAVPPRDLGPARDIKRQDTRRRERQHAESHSERVSYIRRTNPASTHLFLGFH